MESCILIMEPRYNIIDYSKSSDKRQKMTNYLRIGAFQQISGRVIQGRKIYRRRVVLSIIAILFFIIGMYGIFR